MSKNDEKKILCTCVFKMIIYFCLQLYNLKMFKMCLFQMKMEKILLTKA